MRLNTLAGHNGQTSPQVVCTPPELIAAVEKRFGKITFDAAALPENAVAPRYFTPEDDALSRNWPRHGRIWLNPEFKQTGAFLKKAKEQSLLGSKVISLVPASITIAWFRDHVQSHAAIIPLGPGRIQFVGYPWPSASGHMLCLYNFDQYQPDLYPLWNWKQYLKKESTK